MKNPFQWHGKRIIELGAGVGLPGLLLSKYGASQVVLSDHSQDAHVLQNLKESVRMNALNCLVEPLDWGTRIASSNYDLIIGADIFYDPQLFEHTLVTIYQLLSLHPAKCIIAYQERSSKRILDPLLDRYGLQARQIPLSVLETLDEMYECMSLESIERELEFPSGLESVFLIEIYL
jgi:hypothetical protein